MSATAPKTTTTTFYRELPDAEVIWHVLRPLSGDDLAQAAAVRLVHKLGAGVNTIDVDAATAPRHRGGQHARRQRRRRSPRAPCC